MNALGQDTTEIKSTDTAGSQECGSDQVKEDHKEHKYKTRDWGKT
jgi:hypothetical protein